MGLIHILSCIFQDILDDSLESLSIYPDGYPLLQFDYEFKADASLLEFILVVCRAILEVADQVRRLEVIRQLVQIQ
ncbi:hypothetical protein D3C72_2220410 [compost metagenome]